MISISIDDRKVQSALATLIERAENPSSAMASIANRMNSAVVLNFKEEGRPKWKPMAASTLKRGGEGRKLLQKSGHMKNSIQPGSNSHQAWVGTNVEYAIFQQFGTKDHGKKPDFVGPLPKKSKRRGIPARPFLKLTKVDKQDILDIIRRHLSQI